MLRITVLVLAGWTFTAAAQAEDPKTLMTQRGTVVFQDDFSKALDKGWNRAKGKWDIVDGSLRGAELKTDMHGAVMRLTKPVNNAVFQYAFKFDGAAKSSLSLNASKGHLSRVLLSPTSLAVRKDSSDHNKIDKAVTLDEVKMDLKPGAWHTLVVELQGPEILATIDGKHTAYGQLEAINKPKANFGLTVAGESISFKDFRVWEAQPNPTWEGTRAKLLAERKSSK